MFFGARSGREAGMAAALEVRDLRKRFWHDGEWLDVLAGVSLHVAPREFVTLVGPSGCGKSTVCNIAAGLIRPDAGTVTIPGDARPGASSASAAVAAPGRVAYMQQKDLLLPWRTVLDNAILGLEIQGTPRAEAREAARAMLRRFGLDGFERAYPATLSGGMRQRVALVRTLLCRRDLLVLDEPFGALDAMTRAAMQGYLLRLREEFGRTVLLITHDVEEAVLLSDRIYVMAARPGRIRAERRLDLPRPRRSTDPGVVAEKAALLDLLHAELAEAFA
jgi:ABC-type nitrate/sulfonate/bicarbonate transport system ATPase subunit